MSYTFATNGITTKVWTSGASYKVQPTAGAEYNAWAADVGANATLGAFGLTGYYYKGEGAGTARDLQWGLVDRDSAGCNGHVVV